MTDAGLNRGTVPPAETRPAGSAQAWRRERRQALLEQRMGLAAEVRARWQSAMDRRFAEGFPQLLQAGARVALYWPHRGEYDPRELAARLRSRGTQVLLPVIVAPAAPMVFREWQDDAALHPGPHGIAQPAAGPAVLPTVIVAPAVGFDAAGYRLGYGGGYFDRTLATLEPRPLLIGCAHEFARLDTLHPQAHDIPLDYVVTEAGLYRREDGRLVMVSQETG